MTPRRSAQPTPGNALARREWTPDTSAGTIAAPRLAACAASYGLGQHTSHPPISGELSLTVAGETQTPLKFTQAELKAFPRQSVTAKDHEGSVQPHADREGSTHVGGRMVMAAAVAVRVVMIVRHRTPLSHRPFVRSMRSLGDESFSASCRR